MPTDFLLPVVQNPTKICPTVITFSFWFLPKFCNFLTLVKLKRRAFYYSVGRILVFQQCLDTSLLDSHHQPKWRSPGLFKITAAFFLALCIHYDLEQYTSLAIPAHNSFSVFNRTGISNLQVAARVTAMILNTA